MYLAKGLAQTVNYVTHHEWHSGNDQPHMRVIKLAKHDVASDRLSAPS